MDFRERRFRQDGAELTLTYHLLTTLWVIQNPDIFVALAVCRLELAFYKAARYARY